MNQTMFDLLPALYKLRDAGIAGSQVLLSAAEQADLQSLQGLPGPLSNEQQAQLDSLTAKASRGPLQSLLMLIEEQIDLISENLAQFYDNEFIETCAPWAIPYIGDLIGYQAVNGIAASVASPRAEVAHTISFRRRKGTVLVMEQLARDVTGWGAHAVEFFEILATTQYMNHTRPHNYYTASLHNWRNETYRQSGFDRVPHRPDVRRIGTGRGRYNIQNIGIFLWSLTAYSLTDVLAFPVPGAAGCYRFSPLGNDAPLFNEPLTQGADITAAATPANVPAPLARRVLCDDLRNGAGSIYYGEGASLVLSVGGALLNAYQIQVCNLSGADGAWINLPTGNYVAAIDPTLGRIAVKADTKGDVRVSFHYGFNGDLGGGEYARQAGFVVQNEAWVLPFPDTVTPARYTTLQDALDHAAAELGLNGQIAVEITSNNGLTGHFAIDIPPEMTIELRAADGRRPVLNLDGEISVTGGKGSSFLINGLVIASSANPASAAAAMMNAPANLPSGAANQLGQLSLDHCTLVPGWALHPDGTPVHGGQPALLAEAAGLNVTANRTILGGARIDALTTLSMTDSILDATDRTLSAYAAPNGLGGGALTLQGCTVIGQVHATLFSLISNSIFWASGAVPCKADRKQAGCVRFSFLPIGAVTPRQFECVTQAPASPQPLFISLRYGNPGYAELMAGTHPSIRQGADRGGEMGAFHYIFAPLREADLRIRLAEYMPAGLEYGIFYQS